MALQRGPRLCPTSGGGVGDIFDAIRTVATNVGFEKITTHIGRHPKVKLRSTLVNGAAVVECFDPYRPDGWAVERALDNLDEKLALEDFTRDLDQSVSAGPEGYSIGAAANVARAAIRRAELVPRTERHRMQSRTTPPAGRRLCTLAHDVPAPIQPPTSETAGSIPVIRSLASS